jgi:hypothetical protein
MAKVEDVHDHGTRAAQPTPTADQAGTFYFVNDEGLMERWSGSAWEAVASYRKDNLTATTDPDDDDDSGDGYTVGSLWINVTADTVWRCVDATVSDAIWLNLAVHTPTEYYTGVIGSGATHYVPDATYGRNAGALARDDGNSDVGMIQWYRHGTYNRLQGIRASGSFEFRGTTYSAGSGQLSFYIENNLAGGRLAIKNNLGYGRGVYIWPWSEPGVVA